MAKFGDIFSELRKDKGLKQADLAKILFVSPGTISNYENNTHYPDVDKLIQIANYFHVTTDYLLGRCSSPLPPDIFSERIAEDITYGRFIEETKKLSQSRRSAFFQILRDMSFCQSVVQHEKRGNE